MGLLPPTLAALCVWGIGVKSSGCRILLILFLLPSTPDSTMYVSFKTHPLAVHIYCSGIYGLDLPTYILDHYGHARNLRWASARHGEAPLYIPLLITVVYHISGTVYLYTAVLRSGRGVAPTDTVDCLAQVQ